MEREHARTTADMEWRGQTDVSNVGSQWSTIDGPLGVYKEEAVKLAKSFYYGGFLILPVLWGPDVVKSGIACVLFSVVLLAWALTFAFSGASSNMFLTVSRHVLLVLEWLFLRYIGELHHKMKTGSFQVYHLQCRRVYHCLNRKFLHFSQDSEILLTNFSCNCDSDFKQIWLFHVAMLCQILKWVTDITVLKMMEMAQEV